MADNPGGKSLFALPVVVLGIDIGTHGLNRREFIATNRSREDLILRGRHIKMPALACLHDGDGQLPVLLTDVQMGHVTLLHNLMADLPVAVKARDGFRVRTFRG